MTPLLDDASTMSAMIWFSSRASFHGSSVSTLLALE